MKIRIAREELLRKLGGIQGITSKAPFPALSHFVLRAEEEPRILATNLDVSLRAPVELLGLDGPGSACMPSKKLYEIARELEGESEVVIETDGPGWAKIGSGRTAFRVACLDVSEFPEWPGLEDGVEVRVDAERLREMIRLTVFSTGTSDPRYTLNSLLFHLKPGPSNGSMLTLAGTDGHRMALIRATLPTALEAELKPIISRQAALELERQIASAEGEVTVRVSKNHAGFSINGGTDFLVRLVEGSYPDYEQVIPEDAGCALRASRDALTGTLRRVSTMSRESMNAVCLEISDGTLKASASVSELGNAEDVIEVEYEGGPLRIGFNARYLIEALKAMREERVLLHVKDPVSPVMLTEEGRNDYKCVIMPMRI